MRDQSVAKGRQPQILIVEDNWLIAARLYDALLAARMNPIGPSADLERALGHARDLVLDAAILDIGLSDKVIFPVCIVLRERQVPFMFFSGTEKTTLPMEWQKVPFVSKPFKTEALLGALRRLIG